MHKITYLYKEMLIFMKLAKLIHEFPPKMLTHKILTNL
jgi:hypothetical protein